MAWTSQYVLENENGERYDLTPPASIMMVNVEGLGVATGDKFGDIGDKGFFSLTSSHDPQNTIIADLIYSEGAFGNYQVFVDWIHRAKELWFCYAPLETEYRRRVRLKTLQKTKRDGAGYMTATISFEPLTPWELLTPTEIGMTVRTGNVKGYFYDDDDQDYYYIYDSDLQYGGETASDFSATVPASGHIPAAFVLRYTGALTNPEVRVVGASGTVYGICKITGTTSATDTFELSTLYDDSHVRKIASGGIVTDLLSSANLNYELYPHLPADEASVISLTSDSTMTGNAQVVVHFYYRSV